MENKYVKTIGDYLRESRNKIQIKESEDEYLVIWRKIGNKWMSEWR